MATQAEVEALYGPHVATLTIPAANVDETATDFPVYLDLSLMPSTFWDAVRAGDGTADSLRVFVNNAGNYVEKPREIVSADSTSGSESGEVHFLTDTVAGQDAEVILYADGTSADYAVDGTFGRNAVWAGYEAVLHLRNSYTDSTGNNTPTASNVSFTSEGPFGSAVDFSAQADSGVTVGATAGSTTGDLSLQLFAKPNSSDAFNRLISRRVGNDWEWGWRLEGLQPALLIGSGSPNDTTTQLTANVWDKIDVVVSGTSIQFYKAGTATTLTTVSGSREAQNVNTVVGNITDFDDGFTGSLTEARITFSVLSSNWIAQEYANQSDPSTFYTIAANAAPVGVVNVYLGTGAIDKLYLGATEITKAYLGATEIYSAGGVTNNAFELTVETTEANETFLLPMQSVTSIDIDWGDGNVDTNVTTDDPTHVYATAGTHNISVTGTAGNVRFENSGSQNKVRTVTNLGALGWTTMFRAFQDCSNMTSFNAGDCDTSNASSMQRLFLRCSNLTSVNLSNFSTANVNDMLAVFDRCSSLTTLDVSSFNTSNVTRMQSMFSDCTSLTDIVGVEDFNIESLNATTSLTGFAQNVTLPTARYDALLINWDAQEPFDNMTPDFGNSKYTAGGAAEAARTSLINGDGWTITDGGSV